MNPIPATIELCLTHARQMAESGDWHMLRQTAETLALEARVRELDACANEAGVVGDAYAMVDAGVVRPVRRSDGQIGYEPTEYGRELLAQKGAK